jgi:hypothetical protein
MQEPEIWLSVEVYPFLMGENPGIFASWPLNRIEIPAILGLKNSSE